MCHDEFQLYEVKEQQLNHVVGWSLKQTLRAISTCLENVTMVTSFPSRIIYELQKLLSGYDCTLHHPPYRQFLELAESSI